MADTTQRIDLGEHTHRRVRPLSARNALRATAILAGAHGVVLVTSPSFALSLFGAPVLGDTAYWLRNSGVLFIALTIVFWSASRWPASMMQRPMLLAAGIVTSLPAVIGTLTVLDGTVSTAFTAVIGVEVVMATWIWGLLLTDGV
ncbi:MAG: hypothetical protein V1757_08280 [Actinomycetota bacterium]